MMVRLCCEEVVRLLTPNNMQQACPLLLPACATYHTLWAGNGIPHQHGRQKETSPQVCPEAPLASARSVPLYHNFLACVKQAYNLSLLTSAVQLCSRAPATPACDSLR